MRNLVVVLSCLFLAACAGKAGMYGVDIEGKDTALKVKRIDEVSDKPWNELSECIYTDYAADDSAGNVHYVEFSHSKRARIWDDAPAQGLFSTAHSHIWDLEVFGVDSGSKVRAEIAMSIFNTENGHLSETLEKCL